MGDIQLQISRELAATITEADLRLIQEALKERCHRRFSRSPGAAGAFEIADGELERYRTGRRQDKTQPVSIQVRTADGRIWTITITDQAGQESVAPGEGRIVIQDNHFCTESRRKKTLEAFSDYLEEARKKLEKPMPPAEFQRLQRRMKSVLDKAAAAGLIAPETRDAYLKKLTAHGAKPEEMREALKTLKEAVDGKIAGSLKEVGLAVGGIVSRVGRMLKARHKKTDPAHAVAAAMPDAPPPAPQRIILSAGPVVPVVDLYARRPDDSPSAARPKAPEELKKILEELGAAKKHKDESEKQKHTRDEELERKQEIDQIRSVIGRFDLGDIPENLIQRFWINLERISTDGLKRIVMDLEKVAHPERARQRELIGT